MGCRSSKLFQLPKKTKNPQHEDRQKRRKNYFDFEESSSDESEFFFPDEMSERGNRSWTRHDTSAAAWFGPVEGISAELLLLIEKTAAVMTPASLTQLDAALRIRSSKQHQIMAKFPGEVEKQAKAMMLQWVRSEPHPSVEKLLRELQSVGLNSGFFLHPEEKSPRAALNPQQPEHEPPAVIQQDGAKKEKLDDCRVVNVTIVNYLPGNQRDSEREVKAGCPLADIMRVLDGAPDPFTKPRAFHHWLRNLCIVYSLRPRGVSVFLGLVYGSEWAKVRGHFHLPGAGGHVDDDDWPDPDAMISWLDDSCGKSIDEIAWEKADLNGVTLCYQTPKELVSDFLKRFQQAWESTVGLPMEYNAPIMMLILVENLQAHVADIFKLENISWPTYTFSQARLLLCDMERRGMLKPPAPQSNRLSFNRNPRRRRGTDECYYCGRFGHWARECRARICDLAVEYH